MKRGEALKAMGLQAARRLFCFFFSAAGRDELDGVRHGGTGTLRAEPVPGAGLFYSSEATGYQDGRDSRRRSTHHADAGVVRPSSAAILRSLGVRGAEVTCCGGVGPSLH